MNLEDGLVKSCEDCYNIKRCKIYEEEWSKTFHQNEVDDMILKMREMKHKLAETCEYYDK